MKDFTVIRMIEYFVWFQLCPIGSWNVSLRGRKSARQNSLVWRRNIINAKYTCWKTGWKARKKNAILWWYGYFDVPV